MNVANDYLLDCSVMKLDRINVDENQFEKPLPFKKVLNSNNVLILTMIGVYDF